ncbi:hypothetical protein CW702_00620 [Candidatus Bathyarchaeota archaeon]|nr:MAG: hypothetical protein CW702_00620 [Candidatus Bathyarchaeota archaeon]
MLFRNVPSRDEKYYIVEFICGESGGEAYSIYFDGLPLYKAFLTEEETRFLRKKLWDMVISKRLVVMERGTDRKKDIINFTVTRMNRRIKVKIFVDKDGSETKPLASGFKSLRTSTDTQLQIQPVSSWSMSLKIKEYVENREFREFIDLLETMKPLYEERGITEFDGKSIHPISTRTILSEFRIYSKGLLKKRRRDCRTLIFVDRSLSMSNPWSPWDELTKINIAQFLAKVIQQLHFNSHIFSFGENVLEEEDPYSISASDAETRLDLALKEADNYSPEFLVIITDGRPIYSRSVPMEKMSRECIYLLDVLSRSGVNILIAMLGRDPEMLTFYNELAYSPKVFLLDLSPQNYGLLKMMHTIAHYIYS